MTFKYEAERTAARAKLYSARGWHLQVLGPHSTPIVHTNGPVGRLLEAVGRHRCEPRTKFLQGPGKRTLVRTSLYAATISFDRHRSSGQDSLVKDFIAQPAGTPTPDAFRSAAGGRDQV